MNPVIFRLLFLGIVLHQTLDLNSSDARQKTNAISVRSTSCSKTRLLQETPNRRKRLVKKRRESSPSSKCKCSSLYWDILSLYLYCLRCLQEISNRVHAQFHNSFDQILITTRDGSISRGKDNVFLVQSFKWDKKKKKEYWNWTMGVLIKVVKAAATTSNLLNRSLFLLDRRWAVARDWRKSRRGGAGRRAQESTASSAKIGSNAIVQNLTCKIEKHRND